MSLQSLVKKLTAALVSFALLAGPMQPAAHAAGKAFAGRTPSAPIRATPGFLPRAVAPAANPGVNTHKDEIPGLTGVRIPLVPVAPEIKAAAKAAPKGLAARAADNPSVKALTDESPSASASSRLEAARTIYDSGSGVVETEIPLTAGQDAAAQASGLSAAAPRISVRLSAVPWARASSKDGAVSGIDPGTFLQWGGIAAGITAVLAIIPATRPYVARAFNVLFGWIGRGLKKGESAETMAQRIEDQLAAKQLVYAKNTEMTSGLVKSLELQIKGLDKKIAENQKLIETLLGNDNDDDDVLAIGPKNENKTAIPQNEMNRQQLAGMQASLQKLKQDWIDAANDAQAEIAANKAKLGEKKVAEMQAQIARAQGTFDTAGLDKNRERFNEAADEAIAKARGTVDAVESSPAEQIAKARKAVKNDETMAELAREKAEIKARKAAQQAGSKDGAVSGVESSSPKIGYAVQMGFVGALILGVAAWVVGLPSLGALAAVGFVNGLIMPYLLSLADEKDERAGQFLLKGVLFVVGAGIGAVTAFVAAKWFSLAVFLPWAGAATGVLVQALLPKFSSKDPDGLPVLKMAGYGIWGAAIGATLPAYLLGRIGYGLDKSRAAKTEAPKDGAVSGIDPGTFLQWGGIAAGIAAVLAIIPATRPFVARAFNIAFGWIGRLLKKGETAETMAQRIEDQLAVKQLVYAKNTEMTSGLVNSLKLQIKGLDKKIADNQKTIEALLGNDNDADDVLAIGPKNENKTWIEQNKMNREQLAGMEASLAKLKQDWIDAANDAQAEIAANKAKLGEKKVAEMQAQIARAQGTFDTAGLDKNRERFNEAADEAIAKARGTVDAVESSPAEQIAKARKAVKNDETMAELAREKAEIKARKAAAQQGGASKDGAVSGISDGGTVSAAQAMPTLLSKTYSWMTLGLLVSAGMAWLAVSNAALIAALATPGAVIGLAIGTIVLAIGLMLAINKLPPAVALGGFLLYSALNGLFFAPVLAIHTAGSVAAAFLTAAGMFAGMALVGHTTKVNLNGVGAFAGMALWGVILASVANWFIGSTGLDMLLTYASIAIFVALTAYDAQKIREMAEQEHRLDKATVSRIAVIGALKLYLDFVNLFLQLLKLMGKRK